MRNRRRNWLLRRLVLGFAVAAVVAPTAMARVDEGGTAQSDGDNGAVIQSDGKLLLPNGDRVFAPDNGGLMVRGDDKVFPNNGGLMVRGDDKVFAPDGVATRVKGGQPIQVRGGQPINVTGTPSDFNWGDGLIGAAAALGLALLAFGAARATRHVNRPATT